MKFPESVFVGLGAIPAMLGREGGDFPTDWGTGVQRGRPVVHEERTFARDCDVKIHELPYAFAGP